MTRFEIRIEELVVRGLPPAYADRLAERLERELGRLAREAVPDGLVDGRRASVRPHPATEAAADAEGLARQAAEGVWAAVSATSGRTGGGASR